MHPFRAQPYLGIPECPHIPVINPAGVISNERGSNATPPGVDISPQGDNNNPKPGVSGRYSLYRNLGPLTSTATPTTTTNTTNTTTAALSLMRQTQTLPSVVTLSISHSHHYNYPLPVVRVLLLLLLLPCY